MEKHLLTEAIKHNTISAYEDIMQGNTRSALVRIVQNGMSYGYENPNIAQIMIVELTSSDDLVKYGMELFFKVLGGKQTFADLVRELFTCAAVYRAQLIKNMG